MGRNRNKQGADLRTGRAARVIRWCLAVGVALACHSPVNAEEDAISGETLKVALVYKLTKFVEWPAEVADQAGTFELCVHAGNPMAGPLTALGERQTLGRRIRVRLLDVSADVDHRCDLLYLSVPSVDTALRQRAVDRHTLLIGDEAGFANGGGDIEIRRAGRRFRFLVNRTAAENKQLRIAAPLLQLSEIVGSEAR